MRKVLAQTGLTLGQMDVIELNEAFALRRWRSRAIWVCPTMRRQSNGAVALGHPLGASGVVWQ
ncbi:MAG: hypothetical protein ACLRP3_04735 [Escherichia sp.]